MSRHYETAKNRWERLAKLLPYPKGQEQIIEELTELAKVQELPFGDIRLLTDAKQMLVQYKRSYMRRNVIEGGKV